MRAIDLFSGVGGWSLGLKMAGVKVVDSYEHWDAANETNFRNNGHHANQVDIRTLELSKLPKNIDIVVGSPPCVEFSLSNRGGKGDIEDGLIDIVRFLSIVDHLRPRFWAMENVPRAADVIRREVQRGGRLYRYRHLGIEIHAYNMEEFGLPQRRKRCIAGNFNAGLLDSYRSHTGRLNLGDVISAIGARRVRDPVYGVAVPRKALHDHSPEDFLNSEEVALNRAAKTHHPVYNSMPFPDRMDRPVRTITATCTRVSRESVVIASSPASSQVRRLTIRERASLQGFPLTFQFYGATYGQKLRMIGNAVPPLFSYYVAQAMRGVAAEQLSLPNEGIRKFVPPSVPPPVTIADKAGFRFPVARRFRMAIPNLRLKSGVRFELRNGDRTASGVWSVEFVFGTSEDFRQIALDRPLSRLLLKKTAPEVSQKFRAAIEPLEKWLGAVDVAGLQRVWSHRGPSGTHPFEVLDRLATAGADASGAIGSATAERLLGAILRERLGANWESVPGTAKLLRNAPLILAGMVVGSSANAILERSQPRTVSING